MPSDPLTSDSLVDGMSLPTREANPHHRLMLFLLCAFSAHSASALIISPPSSSRDYQQLSSLLASIFDAPAGLNPKVKNSRQQSLKSKIEVLQWNIIEKSLTEEYTYKRYTSNARRMRGKKYCVLVAKECNEESVVGLVEMGMSLCPVPLHRMHSCSGDGNDVNNNGLTTNNRNVLRPQPTVGVLCVNPTHQKKGIAQALIGKCEEVASEVWRGQFIFVDVEPSNQNALTFFEKCGYDVMVDEFGGARMRNAEVSKRRVTEARPHYLLRKILTGTMSGEIVVPDIY